MHLSSNHHRAGPHRTPSFTTISSRSIAKSTLCLLLAGWVLPLAAAEDDPTPAETQVQPEQRDGLEAAGDDTNATAEPLQPDKALQIEPDKALPVVPDEALQIGVPADSPEGDAAPIEAVDVAIQIEEQIETKEFEAAIQMAEMEVRRIESESTRYEMALVTPLVLLGDALSGFGDHTGALSAYDRAIHVTRVNQGLHDPAQVEVVYREAEALFASGDVYGANDRQEYAYGVLLRNYDVRDPKILPGIFHLADWYTKTYNIFSARNLYELAGDLAMVHHGAGHARVIRALRGEARTYRLERFRPSQMPSGDNLAAPRPYGPPQDPNRQTRTSINNYSPGERALLDVVNMLRAKPDRDPETVALAMLDLADWYLLFGQYERAYTLYENVWFSFVDDPQSPFLDEQLRYTKPIFLPLPGNPKAPPEPLRRNPKDGVVELSMTVNRRGDIGDLVTVRSQPKGMMDFKVRSEARRARYRPAFADGKPVVTPNVRLEFNFTYYPRANTAESQTE